MKPFLAKENKPSLLHKDFLEVSVDYAKPEAEIILMKDFFDIFVIKKF